MTRAVSAALQPSALLAPPSIHSLHNNFVPGLRWSAESGLRERGVEEAGRLGSAAALGRFCVFLEVWKVEDWVEPSCVRGDSAAG
eukprot:242562-Rhodomonas_salina.2